MLQFWIKDFWSNYLKNLPKDQDLCKNTCKFICNEHCIYAGQAQIKQALVVNEDQEPNAKRPKADSSIGFNTNQAQDGGVKEQLVMTNRPVLAQDQRHSHEEAKKQPKEVVQPKQTSILPNLTESFSQANPSDFSKNTPSVIQSPQKIQMTNQVEQPGNLASILKGTQLMRQSQNQISPERKIQASQGLPQNTQNVQRPDSSSQRETNVDVNRSQQVIMDYMMQNSPYKPITQSSSFPHTQSNISAPAPVQNLVQNPVANMSTGYNQTPSTQHGGQISVNQPSNQNLGQILNQNVAQGLGQILGQSSGQNSALSTGQNMVQNLGANQNLAQSIGQNPGLNLAQNLGQNTGLVSQYALQAYLQQQQQFLQNQQQNFVSFDSLS